MKKHSPPKSHKYLLWPILVLVLLTIGVFLTTNQATEEQDTRTGAQVFQNPSLFPSGFEEDAPSNTPAPTKPLPEGTVKPVRANINLSFVLPGISSQGGNLTPLRKSRVVKLSFYDPDADSRNKSVLPLYNIEITATYDENPTSPTYTSFVNKDINLEKLCFETLQCVPRGKYQIALKTQQTLQKLSKKKESDVGGRAYDINNSSEITVDFGKLIYGDIAPLPAGDNIIDRKDLVAFTSCFGEKLLSEGCINKQAPDFDDNGFVDGYDYNLLLQSFDTIVAQGGKVPDFNQAEKIEIKEQIPTNTPTPVVVKNQNAGLLGTIFSTIILLVILSAGVFFALKNKKIKSLLTPLLKKSEAGGKEYFIKKHPSTGHSTLRDEPSGSDSKSSGQEKSDGKTVWLTLADDEGQKLGRYHGKDAKEGFAHIKGVPKKENGKEFIEISKIIWEEKS